MRDDFAVFILTHGRPDDVITVDSLEVSGYTGKTYIVIDNQDPTEQQYRDRFGEQVLQFSKKEIGKTFDATSGLSMGSATVVYARNAVWQLARDVGVRYFMVLDDDYSGFSFRFFGRRYDNTFKTLGSFTIKNIDPVLDAMVQFLATTPTLTLAMAQGGDFIGGKRSALGRLVLRRKAMNSFVCDTEKPFMFEGPINEDVNTYVTLGGRGELFFTYSGLQLVQTATQTNQGGLTDAYLETGTYVKSFLTVIMAPSCVDIRTMGNISRRLHHRVKWNAAVPKIMSEAYRKGDS
jgi:hypothetical protein